MSAWNWRKISYWGVLLLLLIPLAGRVILVWYVLCVIAVGLSIRGPVRRWLSGGGRVRCPHCAEAVRREATVCPHCRSDLTRAPVPAR
jgi:hypothetical protein